MMNVYVTGTFRSNANFGGIILTNSNTNVGNLSMFTTKLDPAGRIIWARGFGVFPADYCCGTIPSIAADSSGNHYVAGPFQGLLSIDGFTLHADDSVDAFVAKFDTNGKVVWMEKAGSRYDSDTLSAIAVDIEGNPHISGTFTGSADFGNTNLTSPFGFRSVFHVKFGTLGNVLWARKLVPLDSDYPSGAQIAIDANGNSYIAGQFYTRLNLDGIILTNEIPNVPSMYLANYDNDGGLVWARAISNLSPSSITIDPSGAFYLTGGNYSRSSFDGITLTNGGLVVAKFTAGGRALWARHATASLNGNLFLSSDSAVDSLGNCYVSGTFAGTAAFDANLLTGQGYSSLFITKYDPLGNVVWAKKAVPLTASYLFGFGIRADASGNTFITGEFDGTASFDSTNIMAPGPFGYSDVFVAKLSSGAPIITSHPQNQIVTLGSTASFTVSAINNPPFTYQWQFFGTNLVGETNVTLTITNVQPENAGVYRVTVSNNVGGVFSELATLILVGPLGITTQPQSQTVIAGTNAIFSVTASGTAPFSYRWLFTGTNLPGATNMTLVIGNAQPANAGSYSVIVTNSQGSVTSSVAVLTVRYSLTVNTNGNGAVTRSPSFPIYPPNLPVTLTATPAPGNAFRNWSGDASGSTNPLVIVMTTNKTITANFVATAISISIVGHGTVTKSPDQPFYNAGDSVTLSATPGRWHAFTRWGDGLTVNPRIITIGTSNIYTAIFSPTTAVETLTFGGVSRTAPIGMPTILVDGQFVVTGAVTRLGSAQIELLTTFPNGTMLYTLNGLPPSLLSQFYIVPFTVRRSVTLRALAWDANFVNSWEADPVTVIIEPVYSLAAFTDGGGAIAVSPTNAPYLSNTVVTLTATPDPGWAFLQWLGDASGTSATTSMVMTRDKCVEAVFGTGLNTVASGGGSIVAQPNAALYPHGTVVRLTALPQSGNAFALWGNAGSGTNNPLLYTVTTSNRTVSAAFAPLNTGQFALTVVADGFGTVTNKPRGTRFGDGTVITLTALPDPSQQFLGWTGDASGTQNPLTVTLNQSKVITAQFTKRPTLVLQPCSEPSLADGFQFLLTGEFGGRYQVEKNEAWQGWSPLATVTNTYGTLQFNDAGATNQGLRVYRARIAP